MTDCILRLIYMAQEKLKYLKNVKIQRKISNFFYEQDIGVLSTIKEKTFGKD